MKKPQEQVPTTVVNDSSDLDFNYDDYVARVGAANYDNPPASGGAFDRRNLPVIIADCEGKNTGATSLPILGLACYFMLQEVKQNQLKESHWP